MCTCAATRLSRFNAKLLDRPNNSMPVLYYRPQRWLFHQFFSWELLFEPTWKVVPVSDLFKQNEIFLSSVIIKRPTGVRGQGDRMILSKKLPNV
jgi:hypothetical protein